MAKNYLLSTLIASLLFIGLLVAPTYWAYMTEQGEVDAFELGLSTSEFAGLEAEGDIEDVTFTETQPSAGADGLVAYNCADAGGQILKAQAATLQDNISTSLPIWGDAYASSILDIDGLTPTINRFGVAGSTSANACGLFIYYNVSKADLMDTDVFSHMFTAGAVNQTWLGASLAFSQVDGAGAIVETISVRSLADAKAYTEGTRGGIPVTTQTKLLVSSTFPDTLPAGHTLRAVLGYFIDYTDMPAEDDILIYDMALEGERDGLLDNEYKMIAFNIGYVLIGGLLVVIATPWVSWNDLFGGRGKRPGKRGMTSSMSLGGLALLAVVGVGMAMIFMRGSISDFFAASLLPASLAIMGALLVALSTRGKKNPGMSFAFAGVAAVVGWFFGQAVQNSWLAYDKLYVVPFMDVITGNIGLTDVWSLSAFFVVVIQIAGILVAAYNLATTINTDTTAVQ